LDFNGDGVRDLTYRPLTPNYSNGGAGIVFLNENRDVVKALTGIDVDAVNVVAPGDIDKDGINDIYSIDGDKLKLHKYKIGRDISDTGSFV
jgi:hypothetical protein